MFALVAPKQSLDDPFSSFLAACTPFRGHSMNVVEGKAWPGLFGLSKEEIDFSSVRAIPGAISVFPPLEALRTEGRRCVDPERHCHRCIPLLQHHYIIGVNPYSAHRDIDYRFSAFSRIYAFVRVV